MITRREFLASASALAIVASLNLDLATPALAQGPTELMVPPVLGEMWLGKEDAPITIVEYASLWCSHCGAFHKEVFQDLKKRYIDTGKVRFILREFPNNDRGALGSMLARCAGKDNKDRFFAMVDMLFENQNNWAYVQDPIPPLLAMAKQAGFTEQSFNACIKDTNLLKGLEAEQNRASNKFKVEATPTLFINGKLLMRGVRNIDDLAKELDPLIKS